MNLQQFLMDTFKMVGMEYFKRYYSSYRGIVVKNDDPEYLGRITLKCPFVYGNETFDEWVFPKGIPSGKNWGLYAIPNEGDMVWVSFENGDSRKPLWEYGHWAQNQAPEKSKNLENKNYLFQSPAGQRIEFDDKNEKTIITDKSGNVIEISKDGFQIKKGDTTLKTLMDELFQCFSDTKTATTTGPQPFINIAQYEILKQKFDNFLY